MSTTDTVRATLAAAPDLASLADMFNLAGSAEGLKILYLLENMNDLSVDSMAEAIGIARDVASQHVDQLRAAGLLTTRPDAATLYCTLTDHWFNGTVQDAVNRARG